MLVTLPLANAVITLLRATNAVDGHCGPSQWIIRRYTKSGDRYTSRYTNDPQKGCIRLNSVEHACSNATQNDAVFVQWIKVKVKKVMVGMARFELATS